MTTPHRGRRRVRALAGLLPAAVALLALSGQGASAQDRNNTLTSDIVASIDDIAKLLGQAVDQGDANKEIRQIDQALKHLILALEDQKKGHHHYHKGKGGSIGKGLSQFAGGGSEDQSQQSTQGAGTGTSSIGKGMNGLGRGQVFTGSGGGSQGTGNPTATTGGGSKYIAKSSVTSGINQVSTTINNTFNGPAKVNINNGQQQISLASGLGKKAGTPKTPATGGANSATAGAGSQATTTGATKTGPLIKTTSATGGPNKGTTNLGTGGTAKSASSTSLSHVGKLPSGKKSVAGLGSKGGSSSVSTGRSTSNRTVGNSVGNRSTTAHVSTGGKKK